MINSNNSSESVHWDGISTNLDDIRRDSADSNALLRAAVESANDAIIITEANLNFPGPRIEYVNQAFARMTGYSVDEVRGQTPRILQGPRTDQGLLRRLRDDLQHSKSFHGETINYRKDGSEYYVEWRITPLTDDTGTVIKWVAIQRDVSPRVRAETEREALLLRERTARADAERESRMKDEFLATLSHELRTPLNAIVGWSQVLLSSSRTDEDLEEGLAVIARNARAQTNLIEDLLDMSRIITGKLRLDIRKVDIGHLIDAAIETVSHAATQKGVQLQKRLDDSTGFLSGDASRLQQVIWNLLSNAVKFTPTGGQVEVITRRVDREVEISVSDSGIGIRPEFLPFAFDRFRQEDSTLTRRHGGLGIGLSIVKHIVELHGGHVRVKSGGEGKGTSFVLTLPLSLEECDPPIKTTSTSQVDSPRMQEAQGPDLRGVSVLVVDDEPDARNMVQRILERGNARVTAVSSAGAALRQFSDRLPDVLVSDIGMPDMDGYELIQAIRRRASSDGGNIPAIAVTAFARSEDRRRALVAGFDSHVSKPIEPAELMAEIARWAARPHS